MSPAMSNYHSKSKTSMDEDYQDQGYNGCFPLLNPLLNFLSVPTACRGRGRDAGLSKQQTRPTEADQCPAKQRPTLTLRSTHDTAPCDSSGNSSRSLVSRGAGTRGARPKQEGCTAQSLGAWIRPSSTQSFDYFSDDEADEFEFSRPELNATTLQKDVKLGGGMYGQVHLCRDEKSVRSSATSNTGDSSTLTSEHTIISDSDSNRDSASTSTTSGKKTLAKYYAVKIQDGTKEKRRKEIEQEIEMMLHLGNHPFTCSLYNVYQVEPQEKVALNGKNKSKFTLNCMVMDAYQGGELFEKIHPKMRTSKSQNGLPEDLAQFYAANIWEAISHLHSHHIAYRDLKPENILLDSSGYCHLIDFGFAKYLDPTKGSGGEKCTTFCGTPLYLAPEVLKRKGYDKTADIWSFGVLVFEMLTGQTPFCHEQDMKHMTKMKLYKTIIRGKFQFPTIVDDTGATPNDIVGAQAQDFVRKLLVVQPHKRLGANTKNACAHQIPSHPWLAGISRDELLAKTLVPPHC